MEFPTHKNLAQSLLASVPADRTSGTTFTVAPGDGQLFTPNMPVTLAPYGKDPSYDNAEIARITSVTGDQLVLQRGTEGSIPKIVQVGWVIAGTVTAGTLEAIEDAVEGAVAGVINVKSYGAKGDGTTDDTAAINAAVLIADGGEVYAPAGTYIVDPSISIDLSAGTTFRGAGRKTVFKIRDNADVLDNLFKAEIADKVTLRDFTIDGNRANQAESDAESVNYGVYIAGSDDCRIENVYVHHTTGVGIHVYDSTGTVVRGCESSYNRYHGFECEQDTSTVWSGNRGHHNDRHGIFISPGEVGGTGSIGNIVDSNSFDHNGNYGVGFGIDAAGISIGLTKDNSVTNNTIVANAFYGISIYRVNDVLVTNNIVTLNGAFGIYLYRAERNQVLNNRLRNNSQTTHGAYDEILLEGANDGQASQHNLIEGNYVYIDGSVKANYAIREATNNDGPNVIKGNYVPNAGVSGKILTQHVNTTYELISDTPAGNEASLRTFKQGLNIAPNATLPGGTMGLDAPFGDAVLRVFKEQGSLQFVAPDGNADWYLGGNNVLSATADGLSTHGYRLKDLPTPAAPNDAATKAYTDAGLATKYNASNPAGYVDASQAAGSAPVQSVAGKQGAVTLVKGDVGLGSVDNTSDAGKPVSTATQTALDAKVQIGGDLGGTIFSPTTPTAVHLANIESITGIKTFDPGSFLDKGSQIFDIRAFNPAGNGVELGKTASIVAGTSTLTSSAGSFSSTDVGKSITIQNAGPFILSGTTYHPLTTTISSINSPTSVELATTALYTVSGVQAIFGSDDTAAFNAAYTYALAQGGGEIFIPNRKYYIAGSVIPKTGVGLRGSGANSKLLLGGASARINLDGINSVWFRDFAEYSGCAADFSTAFRVKNSYDVRFQNVYMIENANYAVFLLATSSVGVTEKIWVIDCTITGIGNNDQLGGGVEGENGSMVRDIFLVNNHVTQDSTLGRGYDFAIDIVAARNFMFVGNTTYGGIIFGVEQSPQLSSILAGNICYPALGRPYCNVGTAILATSTQLGGQLLVTDNIVNKGFVRIENGRTDLQFPASIISNNVIDNGGTDTAAQQAGIYVKNVMNANIHGNTITNAPRVGIALDGATYSTVQSNTIKTPGTHGIRELNAADSNYITDNLIETPVTAYVTLLGANSTALNNPGNRDQIAVVNGNATISGSSAATNLNVSPTLNVSSVPMINAGSTSDVYGLSVSQGRVMIGHDAAAGYATFAAGAGKGLRFAVDATNGSYKSGIKAFTISSLGATAFIGTLSAGVGTDATSAPWMDVGGTGDNYGYSVSQGRVMLSHNGTDGFGQIVTGSGKGFRIRVGGANGSYNSGVTAISTTTGNVTTISGELNVPTTVNANNAVTKTYADTADALKAPLASPALTGTPTAPTATPGTTTTQLATTQFVTDNDLLVAHLAGNETSTGNKTFSGATTLGGTTITDAQNIVLGTTTGTKIGTATTQKIGFFNATPVAQQASSTDIGTVASNLGLRASGATYTITTSGAVAVGGGGFRSTTASRTATATLTSTSSWNQLCDATTAAFTITLPAASASAGQMIWFKKTDSTANAVTISRAGSDTLEGGTTFVLSAQNKYVELVNNGTSAWYVRSSN